MSDFEQKLAEYTEKSFEIKMKMQSRLFTLFTETTGYRPEDVVLVEQRINDGPEFKTIYYYDLKHRHQTYEPSWKTK